MVLMLSSTYMVRGTHNLKSQIDTTDMRLKGKMQKCFNSRRRTTIKKVLPFSKRIENTNIVGMLREINTLNDNEPLFKIHFLDFTDNY